MNGESGGQKNAAHHAAKDFEESSDRKKFIRAKEALTALDHHPTLNHAMYEIVQVSI